MFNHDGSGERNAQPMQPVVYATGGVQVSRKGHGSDLRVRRTRKLLGEALVSLVGEKGYDAVSVAEIAERAMVNRATFYLHYEDKYDLLLEVIGATLGEISLANSPLPDALAVPPPALVQVLQRYAYLP